jgi:hypothetical protein
MYPDLAKSSYGDCHFSYITKLKKKNLVSSAPQLETPDHLVVDEP